MISEYISNSQTAKASAGLVGILVSVFVIHSLFNILFATFGVSVWGFSPNPMARSNTILIGFLTILYAAYSYSREIGIALLRDFMIRVYSLVAFASVFSASILIFSSVAAKYLPGGRTSSNILILLTAYAIILSFVVYIIRSLVWIQSLTLRFSSFVKSNAIPPYGDDKPQVQSPIAELYSTIKRIKGYEPPDLRNSERRDVRHAGLVGTAMFILSMLIVLIASRLLSGQQNQEMVENVISSLYIDEVILVLGSLFRLPPQVTDSALSELGLHSSSGQLFIVLLGVVGVVLLLMVWNYCYIGEEKLYRFLRNRQSSEPIGYQLILMSLILIVGIVLPSFVLVLSSQYYPVLSLLAIIILILILLAAPGEDSSPVADSDHPNRG